MAHLKCLIHRRRSLVLENGKPVHRGDSEPCNTAWMTWGNLDFKTNHVKFSEMSEEIPEDWSYVKACDCGQCGHHRYVMEQQAADLAFAAAKS